MAPGSRALLLCLLGSGLSAPAAATGAPSCQGIFASIFEHGDCASPSHVLASEDDETLLLQLNTESKRGASGLAAGAAEEAAAAPAPEFVMKNCVAEFIAMTLFVFIGCGSAMSIAKVEGSAWVLQVSLTFGLAITVLAYTIGHYSGAHINGAVTFGLMLHGDCSIVQGIGNIVAQLLGSVLGAWILLVMYGSAKDQTGGLGTNGVAPEWSTIGALIGEVCGTFVLMYVVFETAVNPANASNKKMAPLAIGFAVFLAHSVLIPVDGCSINPTRSFGPALVNVIHDHGQAMKSLWLFFVGPLIGAAAAAGVYSLMTLDAL